MTVTCIHTGHYDLNFVSECLRITLRGLKILNFSGGGACPQTPLQIAAYGRSPPSTIILKTFSPKLKIPASTRCMSASTRTMSASTRTVSAVPEPYWPTRVGYWPTRFGYSRQGSGTADMVRVLADMVRVLPTWFGYSRHGSGTADMVRVLALTSAKACLNFFFFFFFFFFFRKLENVLIFVYEKM